MSQPSSYLARASTTKPPTKFSLANPPRPFAIEIGDRPLKKVREYFQAGVRLVWVIFPDAAEVHVYNATKSVQVLDRTDVLRGEPVLPGFRLALADLFDADAE